MTLDQIFQSAVGHHQRGALDQAEAQYREVLAQDAGHADALHYLGVCALQRGRPDLAAELIARSVAQDSANAESHYHLGLALGPLGRLEEAAAHNRHAIALRPDYAEAHMNLGNALKGLGRLDEAIASFRRSTALRPALAEAHFNLGNALADRGALAEAADAYRRAIAQRPGYADAHQNLGSALHAAGKPGEAMAEFRNALQINPDLPQALTGLALGLMIEGRPLEAIELSVRLLGIRDDPFARNLFVECAASLRQVSGHPALRPYLLRALAEQWCWPRAIAPTVSTYLKLNGPVGEALRTGPQGLATATALGTDTLLLALIESVHIADPQLEDLLTAIRRSLLDAATGNPAAIDGTAFDFACALARQCFNNDYVFHAGEDEWQSALALRKRLAAAPDDADAPRRAAVLGCYVPLHTIADAGKLLARTWPAPLAAVFAQQVAEPMAEWRLRDAMPRLTAVDDNVSLQVRQQYEENPYPRWSRPVSEESTKPLDVHIAAQFPLAPYTRSGRTTLDILAAGCGTGLSVPTLARKFSGARVLAVDLSLASLGYAKRKADELRLDNVEFAQADILKLGDTGRSFDLIESSGVLHHLGDPLRGWRVLIGLLRPGGVMRIALYSAAARMPLDPARAMIAAGGYGSDADSIRRFRRDVAALPDGHPAKAVMDTPDWFTTSECRDLLFHVQEHRFTLPQIRAFVDETGLVFLGFDLETGVKRRYLQHYPGDRAMTALEHWDTFERAHPATFAGMYQFWLQKPKSTP